MQGLCSSLANPIFLPLQGTDLHGTYIGLAAKVKYRIIFSNVETHRYFNFRLFRAFRVRKNNISVSLRVKNNFSGHRR